MIKNKYIILPFLFLAWTIIFAHSVIPHHHHDQNNHIELCKNIHFIDQESIQDQDHDCCSHTCHFHVDILIKINIDDIFILNTENLIAYDSRVIESFDCIYNQELITPNFYETNYLRGPPQIA